MGARPVTALNLVAFSLERLGAEVLGEILRGGADIAAEAGVAIVGGHSIDDPEPKYGMAVTGVVASRRVSCATRPRRAGRRALPDQAARRRGRHDRRQARDAPARAGRARDEVMTTLNARGRRGGARGRPERDDRRHRLRPARPPARDVVREWRAARVEAEAVPADRGRARADRGRRAAGGSRRNREWLEPHVEFGPRAGAVRHCCATP